MSEGGYPAGTLSWHLDGKPLIPDGKGESQASPPSCLLLIPPAHTLGHLATPSTLGVSVKEEARRHPETGLFTLQSELTVTPAQGGVLHPTFSCSFRPGRPRRRALHTAPIQLSVQGKPRGG